MAGPMLRALLEDRFKLRVHREPKEVPVYFLTLAKNGPKLEATKEGSCVPIDANHIPAPIATPGQPLPNYCGPRFQLRGLTATLTSRYDFQIDFEYAPRSGPSSDPGAPEPPAASEAPSIFEVLQAKLGLKLEPGKGPGETLVIDHVERPTEN